MTQTGAARFAKAARRRVKGEVRMVAKRSLQAPGSTPSSQSRFGGYWLLPAVAAPAINLGILFGLEAWRPSWYPPPNGVPLIAGLLLVEWAVLVMVLAISRTASVVRVTMTLVVLTVVSFAAVTFVGIPVILIFGS